jgi:Leucine-rich repeat (LRR) protein
LYSLFAHPAQYVAASLSLGLNSFHPGPLPSEIPLQLTNLSSLFLTSASLTGTLSTEIGSLTNLSELYLSENRFTGLLPTEVGLCKDLRVFEVASNNFRGQIPTQFGSLTSLEILSLIDNSFTGTIPTELGMNINLFRLVFATNRLTGLIPAEVCNLWNHKLLELGTYTGSCSNDAYGGASCPNNACCPNCQTSG